MDEQTCHDDGSKVCANESIAAAAGTTQQRPWISHACSQRSCSQQYNTSRLLDTQGAGSDTIREPFKVTSPTQHASR